MNGLWAVVVAALAYYALFQLPFWFPPRLRLWSASYAFGFNNGVAILAMAGLLAAVALLYVLRRHRACEPQIEFPLDRTIAGRRSLVVALALVALLYAGLTFAMYVYSVRSASWLMWETRHFLHRTWLMDVYGLRPYTEFSAEYGPMLTYTPLYMYWLLKPLGASHEQAYFACHLLLNLGGLWCLYYVLSRVTMPASPRLIAFGVLAIAGFAPYMGLNGVLLRYLCPFACLLLGHRAVVWALSRPGCALCWLGTAATVLLLLGANILLSPEAAVAFALAWLGYSVLMVRRDGRVLAVSLIAFIAAGLLCWLLLPAAYYGSLLRFSEGANNLPLLPAAHLLFYIVTMFLVVPPLLAAGVREPATGDVTRCRDLRRAGRIVCGDGTRRAGPLRSAPRVVLRHGSVHAADGPAGKHLAPRLCGVHHRVRRRIHRPDAGRKPGCLLWGLATGAPVARCHRARGREIAVGYRHRAARHGYTVGVGPLSAARPAVRDVRRSGRRDLRAVARETGA